MQKGFDLLNGGEFGAAEEFFSEILDDYPSNITAQICHGRAVGLGGKSSEALKTFELLHRAQPQSKEIKLNLAEAYLWNTRSLEAQQIYAELLSEDPLDFTSNLGMANALSQGHRNYEALSYINKALSIQSDNLQAITSKKFILIALAFNSTKGKKFKEAHKWLDSVDFIQPNQKNALEIRELIKKEQQVHIQSNYHTSIDNAYNEAKIKGAAIGFSLHPRTKTNLHLGERITSSPELPEEISQRFMMVKNSFFLYPELEVTVGTGLFKTRFSELKKLKFISESSIVFKPDNHNYWQLSHLTNYMDYNNEIAQNEIRQDRVRLEYQYFSNRKWAFYGFGAYHIQSDENHAQNYFASLYYQPLSNPVIKAGVSYNYLDYLNPGQSFYFSPDQYQLAEVFFHIENLSQKNANILYKCLIAPGAQKIEDMSWQQTFRIECALGIKISDRWMLMADYQYSNTAQSTQAGAYQFKRYGLSARASF